MLQPHDIGVGVVAFEVEDIADVGAAKFIDRLVVVADHANIAVVGRELTAQQILGLVGILVLVDEQVFEALLEFLQDFRVPVELAHDLDEQIVEIKGIVAAELGLVGGVEIGQLASPGVFAGLAGKFKRVEHGVFGLADLADHGARGQVALVDIMGFEHPADHGAAVVLVVDRKV